MLLLSSASFPHYGLERFFRFAQAAGFHGVEIQVNHNFDTHNAEYLESLAQEYSVEIRAFSLASKNTESYLSAFENVLKHFTGAHANVTTPELFSSRYKKWLTKIAPKLAKQHGVFINRTNTEPKMFLGFIPLRPENSLYRLKQAGHVSLDTAALAATGQDLMRTLPFLGQKLRHIYLSNVYKGKPYARLEEGILPLESFLTKLAQKGYPHDFTLLLNPGAIHEGDEPLMHQTLVEQKAFFDQYFTAS